MFTVDPQSNRIKAVKTKTFSELKLTERNHLQEWLAHTPNSLGEELLIIQKEFAGFDDTNERLDLLALDKNGNLVIIENKLDDSGRDVVWQAMKYASYCSSLSKMQVVDIYQQYLNRYHRAVSDIENQPLEASEQICEFLDAPDLDEVKLNLGSSQRIVLVAANFRKEVTSTAVWLLGQGVDVKCIKVTPYTLDGQLIVNFEQIIPTPEEAELTIGIKAKEAEEKSTEVVLKKRFVVRRAYWEQLLETFQKSDCVLYNNISASKDHWLSAGCGLSGCHYALIFAQKEIRVELTLGRSNTAENKLLFDALHAEKEAIEAQFGEPIVWHRLDEKKSSRLQFGKAAESTNQDLWPEWIAWHLEHMSKFEKALKGPLMRAAESLKQGGE